MRTLDETTLEFLSGRRYATLATHNDDGSIHATPVWYLLGVVNGQRSLDE